MTERDHLIGGRYRLDSLIAEGGMGEIWRAHDELLDRRVAVKLLRRALANDATVAERFRREARVAASLTHPNMANVYDYVENGHPGIVMELVEGETLADKIAREAPIPVDEAVRITDQILDALGTAHAADLIHRDVKPANVLLDQNGQVKVTDFGIARALGESTLTETGAIVGTAHYLSPEQVQGRAPSPSSDLYAAGVILYEMLTAKRPFGGETTLAVAMGRLTNDPTPVADHRPDLPSAMQGVLMRSLARDPAERYTDATQMRAALQAASREEPLAAGAHVDATQVLVLGADATQVIGLSREDASPQSDFAHDPAVRRWSRLLSPLWIALGVGLLALLLIMLFRPGKPVKVSVPLIERRSLTEATQLLERSGLKIHEARRVVAALPVGFVVHQMTGYRSVVEKGSTVEVTVSSGPPPCCAVPNVVGKTTEEAKRLLESAGLRLGDKTSESSLDKPSGTVLRQTPAAGASLSRGSSVDIVVAMNPPHKKRGKG